MNNFKKMLMVSLIVALAAQVNISLFITGFKVSGGIILFPILLFVFTDLNIVRTGILAAIMVYISRIGVHALGSGTYDEVLWAYFPEIFFYAFYGVLFTILNRKNPTYDLNKLFPIMVICDFSSNIIEIIIRFRLQFFNSALDIMGILSLVAIIRSSIVWMALNGLKYYRMFILKGEHEERYKKLLWMTSRLNTEVYWMEKNMDDIERVMANAYELFEKISQERDEETWANLAVTIAKDVHEIKKEYGLVVRGLEEIVENKLKDRGMPFKDILTILKESMSNEARYRGQRIDFNFKMERDFYTTKHYYLMSIFRNLLMNAMDAVSLSKGESTISLIHEENRMEHIFHITDSGCGIKQKDLSFIFSPGFSTKINYSTGHINRGLGLSLVKDIVEEYLQGKIEVHSIEGKGSTFLIYSPKEILEVVDEG